MSVPSVYRFEDLTEGLTSSRDYVISDEAYGALTDTFGDRSPIHMDEDIARGAGFTGRVMHGAILNAFLSHFVGMVMPGALSVLQSVDLRYLKPSYLGERVALRATVAQRSEAARTVVLDITVTNVDQNVVVARGRAQVGIRHG